MNRILDKRLESVSVVNDNYFTSLLEEVREIRASERSII
ncbi:MAG: virulence RhuM family protein [Bacteroidaceae bacterium]|nr:virulence RhuM family protein [Bacteroidaceae bacterium]